MDRGEVGSVARRLPGDSKTLAPSSLIQAKEALGLAAAALRESGTRFALVGGLAVSARTEPRFTRDVDLAAFAPDDSAAERIVFDLQRSGFQPAVVIEHTTLGRLATVRLTPPTSAGTAAIVDILFASSGIEPEVVGAATAIRLAPKMTVPVARVGHLIAMKLLSCDADTRPQDLVDLVALAGVATEEEVSRARDGVRLIVERGFSRGRDLPADLDRLLARRRR